MAVPPDELHRLVLSVIIHNSEGKYFIAKRAMHKYFPGKWHVPGGGVAMNDYANLPSSTPDQIQWYGVLENSLKREIREEVNIEIGNPEYVTDVAFIRPDGIPVVVLSFFASYVSGDIEFKDGENTDYAWVSLEEAKTYDLIPGIWHEIETVDKILKSKLL
jgi:8-oxo-dGTP pyrophosphatase MutT (NUDIX family)